MACRLTLSTSLLFILAASVFAQGDWPRIQGAEKVNPQSTETETTTPVKPRLKHKEKISFVYDKFKDITVLRLEYMNVGEGVTMGAFASATGRVSPTTSTAILLAFSLYNERWRCLNGCDVTFIIDGERLRLGTAENLEREIGGAYGVIERIGILISFETMKKLAFANSVEFQAGRDEAKLKPTHLAALQEFTSKFFLVDQ